MKSLWTNTRGGVAVIFALSIIPVFVVIGMTIDTQRMIGFKSKIEVTLDAATLAAANLYNTNEAEQTVSDFLRPQLAAMGLSEQDVTLTVESETSLTARRVEASLSIKFKLLMMPMIGRDYTVISVRAVAEQSIPNLEISMVLDISSSMNGRRLTQLKSASQDFVDTVLDETNIDTTSVNIVPFGGTVNIGPLFDLFAVPLNDPNTIIDPKSKDYDIGQKVEDEAFRFTQGDKCLEARKEDYGIERLPAFSRAQVPHFWRWWNFQPWCPGEPSAVFLNSNDRSALKSRLSNLVLSDGTGMDVGALWGLKTLSPELRGDLGGDFSERPLDFDAENSRKIMIVMTDGEITEQNRPEDIKRLNVHTNRNTNYEPNVRSRSNQGNRRNMQRVLTRGSTSHNSNHDSAVGRFKNVCETAKAQGITIFTIGFQIRSNSLADKLLEDCASSANNYYHVESLDIAEAFSAIAAQIHELRITS